MSRLTLSPLRIFPKLCRQRRGHFRDEKECLQGHKDAMKRYENRGDSKFGKLTKLASWHGRHGETVLTKDKELGRRTFPAHLLLSDWVGVIAVPNK